MTGGLSLQPRDAKVPTTRREEVIGIQGRVGRRRRESVCGAGYSDSGIWVYRREGKGAGMEGWKGRVSEYTETDKEESYGQMKRQNRKKRQMHFVI